MNLSQYKKWRALLHTVIVKEHTKREQPHPVCSHTVEKYKKVENVNTQNDYERRKKSTDKKKADLFFVFKCF